MSDLRPNNGGAGPPDDGGAQRGGLPDLPPEWGTVVIPDNAAELDAEATAIRRELRREAWLTRARGLTGLGPGRRDVPSLGVPLVIIAVAVITTLLSLFVVTWDHRRTATPPVGPEAAQMEGSVPIADVSLTDTTGVRVRLRDLVPAILLLVEDCDCASLVSQIALATPPPITVVPVTTAQPCVVGTVKNVRCLVDPAGTLTGRYPTAAEALAASDPATASPTPGPPSLAAPTAEASGATPTPTAPPIVALAVPMDADGAAHDAILVRNAVDLREAFAALTAGD